MAVSINSILKKIIVIYFLSMPILRYYELPGGSNLWLLLANIMLLTVYVINGNYYVNRMNISLYAFIVSWFIARALWAYELSSYKLMIVNTSKNNCIVFFDCIIMLMILYYGALDCDYFIRIYKYFCWFVIAFLMSQIVLFSFADIVLDGNFLLLKLDSAHLNRCSIYPRGLYTQYSSVFMEPSHLAQYLAPFLCLNLIGYKKEIKSSIFKALIISIGMLMSISGTSVCIVAIIWLIYFVQNLKKETITIKKSSVVLYIFLIAALIIGGLFSSQMVGINDMVISMSNLSGNKTSDRVLRGFIIWWNLPLVHKIFGIGYQCIYAACSSFGIALGNSIANGHNEYVNDVASILVSFGIIGVIPIIVIIKKLVNIGSPLLIMMILCLISIFISESTIGILWVMFMCVGICCYKSSLKVNL